MDAFTTHKAEPGWLHVIAGGLLFLLLSLVVFLVIPDERVLLGLAFLPFLAYLFWKSVESMFPFTVLVVSASYLGGVFYAAEGAAIPLTPFQILLIISIVLFVCYKMMRFDFEIRLTGFELLVSAFLGMIFFSLIYSTNPEAGFFEAFRIIALLFFVLYILNTVSTVRQMAILLIAGTVVSLSLAAVSAYQSIINPEIAAINYLMMGRGIAGRAAIGDMDPNFFATIFFLPIAFTAAIAHSDMERKWRWLALAALGILLIGAISTYSRSAWVAIFFIGAIVIFHFRNFRIVLLAIALGALLLILIPDLRMNLASVYNRVMDIFSGSTDASSMMRIVLGMVAIRMFVDNVLFGIGFRAFPIEFEKYNEAFGMLGVNEPHNITYAIFTELGLIGFLIFGLLLFFLFRLAYRNLKMSREHVWDRIIAVSLFAALIGYFVFHQFIPRFLTNSTMYVNIALVFVHHLNLKDKVRNG